MKNRVLAVVAALAAILVAMPPAAGALRVAPLSYNVVLANGQKQKGFIDITNTEAAKTTYTFNVQAFRQLNDRGDLEFYDDETIRSGILLDFNSFELEPGQTLRLAFIADGTKLPTGDSFGAIFAVSTPRPGAASAGVRVGTILAIQNGTPGERKAEITGLTVPFWQIGDAINGSYTVKNTSDPAKSTGFMPKVSLQLTPFSQSIDNQSSLVFAGIERRNDFEITTKRFGFYKVTASFNGSNKQAWVFFATPIGCVLFGAAVALGFIVIILLVYTRRRTRGRMQLGTKQKRKVSP